MAGGMPNKLTNLRIDEVSSVDRGAGMGVRVLLMKRDDANKNKQKPDNGTAHKALELALTSILGTGDTKAEVVAKLSECFTQFHKYLNGDQPKEQIMDITKEALEALIAEGVAKSLENPELLTKLGLEKKKKPAKPENTNSVGDEEDGPDATGGADSAAGDTGKNFGMSDDEAKKFLEKLGIKVGKAEKPVDTEVAKAQAEVIDLRKRVEELTEKSAVADFAKRAENIGLPPAEGENLRKAFKGDLKSLEWMIEKIATLNKQVEKAGLFNEVGSGGGGGPVTAHAELEIKAAELRKNDPKLTSAMAFVKAMEMNPDIAKREREEAHARIQKVAQ